MKIAILTSSRADYSIYLPLLKALKADQFFDLQIIVFGTHLSKRFGETANQITADGFEIAIKVDTMPDSDSPSDISAGMGKTVLNFSSIWKEHQFDLVVALGDRYEMFAACASSIPFGVKIAHIHGGETTKGAIDDIFRNSLSLMATYHFTTTDIYKNRVIELLGKAKNVFNVGALSVDNLNSLKLLSVIQIKKKFGLDLNIPSILITFHPETVDYEKNREYINELISALKEIYGYQFVITMPNADTMGNMVRQELNKFISICSSAYGIESFGTLGYLSAMKHCHMMLGNTSSGFVEAAFFNKYVINIGERQRGRILTKNIRSCNINKDEIIAAVSDFKHTFLTVDVNIYGDGKAAQKITSLIKQLL